MAKTALIILDGWGIGDGSISDATSAAQVNYFRSLHQKYAKCQLLTSGEDVGLPNGQMGNSEVGHLNIGAGRVVYQDLVKINKSIKEGDFFQNKALRQTMQYARDNNKALHFIGLLSNGGVHSSEQHLYALCKMAKQFALNKVYIHAIMDGRDTDPKSGLQFIGALETYLNENQLDAKIATVIGRYYAMDRDQRWERVKVAYDLYTTGTGKFFTSGSAAVEDAYQHGITDEFIEASLVDGNGCIHEQDAVVCFNFRTDRCREITDVLTQKDLPEYGMKKLSLFYTTMTRYDEKFKDVQVCFEKDNLSQTLGEVIAAAKRTQLRAAETEKYPHVTFFFSGGREAAFDGEIRVMEPSPKVATYDLQPEMSAQPLKDKVINMIESVAPDFICLNFANPDMVGHTGVYAAVVKALETVDNCLKEVTTCAINHGYNLLIIADHGNADYMLNPDGSPNTAHSLNPVPCILVGDEKVQLRDGRLADVAPTILELMGIDQPLVMDGRSLIVK